ncbi:MAG: DUF1553 domain-containing protein [Planctomycetes bacterium]|nr:DUF1553 domain-containing protein [Planctomycetota bacterium]
MSRRHKTIVIFATLLISASQVVAGEDRDISFQYDVLPALSKQGCSGGACHGSPNGKGGFRLSLRGFDAELDRLTLLRETTGRRIDWLEPANSLILLKPTMQVAHGGGKQLQKDDLAYSILHDWIAAQCPDDPSETPRCVRIELQPPSGELTWPVYEQQLKVVAFFADRTIRDVTALTVFTTSEDQVATVDGDGLVKGLARGETRIMARYLDYIDTTDLRFLKPIEGFEWNPPLENNLVDRQVFARLQRLQIQPSASCTHSEFIRRVYLDVVGILPTRTETESFLADDDEGKRRKLIDRLLEREEYAEFWAQKWSDLLRVKSSKLSTSGVHKFHRWMVRAVRENRPYDRIATELLTARGSTFSNPPASFYRAIADPNDCAESVSQLFLGIRIQCARCHNHPFDQWSQDNYYGIGAFFSRVQRKPVGTGDDVFVWLDRSSEATQPRTGKQLKPWLPLEGDVEVAAGEDRRELFADWLTSPDNPFFARVAVNRIWAHLLGRGIVDPVDDFRADNPAAHPELLDALADAFINSGYDQKQLIRSILNSQVYQLSSKTNASNEQDRKYFSHAYARPLGAEQLFDAICQTTDAPERFANLPVDTRATSLPSPEFGNEFLSVFGQPSRNTVCECERSDDSKLSQTLQLINGPLIPRKLRDSRGRLARSLSDLPARIASAGQPHQDGIVAWFKANEGAINANGVLAGDLESVLRWENQCEIALSASQANSEHRPSYVSSSIGGLPAIRFDGVNDLLHNAESALLPGGSARTIFVVGRLADDRGGALLTFGRARQNGSSVFTAQHVQIGGSYYLYSDGVNGAGNTTAPVEQLKKLHRPFVTSFISSGTGDKLQVRVNGSTLPTSQPGGVGVDQGSPGFTIGSREDIPPEDQSWSGEISELLVYDRKLSDEQLSSVGTYLATKYDLPTAYSRPPLPQSAGVSDREIIIDFYFAALCRKPNNTELQVAVEHIESISDRRRGLEDVAWALMNSKEFVFQH